MFLLLQTKLDSGLKYDLSNFRTIYTSKSET